MKASEYAKAITAAGIAGLGALGTALADDSVTVGEWVVVAIATLTGFGAVFRVPNQEPLVPHQPRHQQSGQANLVYLLVAGLVVIILLVVLFQLLPLGGRRC